MNYGNVANGDWMNLGVGNSYGGGNTYDMGPVRDGTQPASSGWGMFAGRPVCRI